MSSDGLRLPVSPGARLVLVRHGQSVSNIRHVMDTVPPGAELTEEGTRQAQALARRFADETVHAVFASRAVRAMRTAEPLALHHGLDVDQLDGIHEIHVGELEGTVDGDSRRHFEEIYGRWHDGAIHESMPGGETGRQALGRFYESARWALNRTGPGTTVLVSHGAMLRLVTAQLVPRHEVTGIATGHLPNAGIIVLEPDDSETGWRCAHRDGPTRDD